MFFGSDLWQQMASEVARFPGLVQRAEGSRNVARKVWAAGGVDGIGAREGSQ